MAVAGKCLEKFIQLKKRAHRYITFKIENNQIVIDKAGGPDETYDQFTACLPEADLPLLRFTTTTSQQRITAARARFSSLPGEMVPQPCILVQGERKQGPIFHLQERGRRRSGGAAPTSSLHTHRESLLPFLSCKAHAPLPPLQVP